MEGIRGHPYLLARIVAIGTTACLSLIVGALKKHFTVGARA
jgi:hypothetical protein